MNHIKLINSGLITEPVLCHYHKSKNLFLHNLGLYISARKNLNSSCQSVTYYCIFKGIYVQIGKYSLVLMA